MQGECDCAAVIGASADALACAVAATLRGRGVDVLFTGPYTLADLRVGISGDTFTAAGRTVGAIVFRAPPDISFSQGFRAEDRSFCDTETRALWLAASHLASVLAVNRYQAGAWFGETGWTRWRCLLRDAGVPLAPFAFGDVPDGQNRRWCPYAGGQMHATLGRATRRTLCAPLTLSEQAQTSLVVGEEVVEGQALPAVTAAAAVLGNVGIHVAAITTDGEGRVLLVDTLPIVERSASVQRSAHLLSELCYAHLRCR